MISCLIMVYFIAFMTNLLAPEATMMMHVTGIEVSGTVTDSFFGYNLMNVLLGMIHHFFMV